MIILILLELIILGQIFFAAIQQSKKGPLNHVYDGQNVLKTYQITSK